MKGISFLCSLLLGATLYGQIVHIDEDFNAGALPSGWSNLANTGTNAWSFGLDGSSDHTGNQNLDGSSFAYFDDSFFGSSSLSDNTSLVTASFDNSGRANTTLEFDYNFRQFGANVPDSFKVEVYDGSNWNLVFSKVTDDCGSYVAPGCFNGFPHAVVNIGAYANANCQVRFTYYDGGDWGWYAGLDNVEIYSPADNDLGVNAILSPQSSCGLSSAEDVTVQIVNFGALAQSNFSVSYQLDAAPSVTETVSASISGGDTLVYTFTTKANVSAVANYSLVAYTTLSNDNIIANDTASSAFQNILSFQLPYNESFENGLGDWSTYGTNNSWAVGVPSLNNADTAIQGVNIAATNLSGAYNNAETSYLASPCFDFSNVTSAPIMSFWINYTTESPFDGCWIEYSTDGGSNWTKLGASSNALNWYNNSTTNTWTGNSNGWLYVRNELTGLNNQNQVNLRLAFQSDANTSFEGIAIDDIVIKASSAVDMGVRALMYPLPNSTPECGFTQEPIIVMVENDGSSPISSFDMSYQVDGGIINTETFNVNLNAFSDTILAFTNTFDFSTVKNFDLDIWVSASNDGYSPNDSLVDQLIANVNDSSESIAYEQDFDNFALGTVGEGWTTNSGNYNWEAGDGGTPTTFTGPAGDNTTGTGVYIYTEASAPAATGDVAILTSPCIDLTAANNFMMSFWYHKYGFQMGDLFIDIYDGSRWITGVNDNGFDRILGATNNGNNDPWILKEIDISQFSGRKIKVRFRGERGGVRGDMAIDDFRVWEPINQDAEMSELYVERCYGTSQATVEVEVFNFGTQAINSGDLDVNFQVGNGPIVTETVNSSINSNATFFYTFTQSASITSFPSEIKAWTSLVNDSNMVNDSASLIYEQGDFEDFENEATTFNIDTLNSGWYVDQTAPANWFVLAGDYPNANRGPSADHTLGASGIGQYIASANNSSILISPCIDLRGMNNPNFTYWYHMFGAGNSTLFLQSSTDGVNWSLLRVINGPVQQAKTDPWNEVTIPITNNALRTQTFQLRFVTQFAANSAVAVDDIRFWDQLDQDASLLEITTASCYQDSLTDITVEIENAGADPIQSSTLTVNYQVGNGPVVSELVSSAISPNQTLSYTFNQSTNIGFTLNDIHAWTTLLNDSNLTNDSVLLVYDNRQTETFEAEDITSNGLDTTSTGWFTPSGSTAWDIFEGDYPDPNTGPVSDHTLGIGAFGNYLVTDGNATVVSPCINFKGSKNSTISYWYHIYGVGARSLFVESSTDGINWNPLDTINGPVQPFKNSAWLQNTISVSDTNLLNQEFQVRFRTSIPTSISSVIAIDDINFNAIRGNDLELVDIVGLASSSCPNPKTPVSVKVINRGVNPLDFTSDTLTISTSIFGILNTSLSDTVYDNSFNNGMPLMPDDSMLILLDSVDLSGIGSYTIFSILSMASDIVPTNNGFNTTFTVNSARAGNLIVDNAMPCQGETVRLDLLNSFGQTQWEENIGGSWNSIAGASGTFLNYTVNADVSIRAVTCGSLYSDTIMIQTTDFTNYSLNDSISATCGFAPNFVLFDANASSSFAYRWYDGNNLLYRGDTLNYTGTAVFAPNVYTKQLGLEILEKGINFSLGINANANWMTAPSSLNQSVNFDVYSDVFIESVDVYATSAGSLQLEIQNRNSSAVIFDSTYNLAMGANQIALEAFLNNGNYRFVINAAGTTVSGLTSEPITQTSYWATDSSIRILAPSRNYYYYYNIVHTPVLCQSSIMPVNLFADCLVGLDELETNASVTIFPNPTNGMITLEWEQEDIELISVINQLGQEIANHNVNGLKRFKLEIDGDNGLYFIRTRSANNFKVYKVLKSE